MTTQTERTVLLRTPPRWISLKSPIWIPAVFTGLVFFQSDAKEPAGSGAFPPAVVTKADAAVHHSTENVSLAVGAVDREDIKSQRASKRDATRITASADRQPGSVPTAVRRNNSKQPYVPVSGIRVVTGQMESTLMVGEPIVRCGCR